MYMYQLQRIFYLQQLTKAAKLLMDRNSKKQALILFILKRQQVACFRYILGKQKALQILLKRQNKNLKIQNQTILLVYRVLALLLSQHFNNLEERKMKKMALHNQKTQEQYYKFPVPAKPQQPRFRSPTSPLKQNKILSYQGQYFRQGSISKGRRLSYSKPKKIVRKLSSNLFKEAHIVKSQTFLPKQPHSPKGLLISQMKSRNSKKSIFEPKSVKIMNNESKLQIKKVVQIRVQGQPGDLTKLIFNFEEIQQKRLMKKLPIMNAIPQIPEEIQRLVSNSSDCNQTLLDLMNVIREK